MLVKSAKKCSNVSWKLEKVRLDLKTLLLFAVLFVNVYDRRLAIRHASLAKLCISLKLYSYRVLFPLDFDGSQRESVEAHERENFDNSHMHITLAHLTWISSHK